MFDTTTTAFYHTNGGQPARGLFSNIALPSSLPSQLLQNSFVMFPLSGLFGQQQNTEIASTTTTTPTVAAITAPVSPPCSPLIPNNNSSGNDNNNNNDNTTNNNNNNNNNNNSNNNNSNNKRSSRRSKNQNSTTQAVSSVSATQMGNHHISPRRKKLSNRMNRKLIDQSITLSAIAVEEDQQGNHQCALDLYLNALESMLYAMPIHSDAHRKEAVAEKLHEFIERVGLADRFATPHRDCSLSHSSCPEQTSTLVPDYTSAPPPKDGISSHIISAAVNSAVALKQSPIPDAISATVNYTMKKVKQIDEAYRLQEKAWEISRTGINLALEIDQQYNVHEKVGNAIFLTLAAAMKAGIAYKDSPSYQELKRVKAEYIGK